MQWLFLFQLWWWPSLRVCPWPWPLLSATPAASWQNVIISWRGLNLAKPWAARHIFAQTKLALSLKTKWLWSHSIGWILFLKVSNARICTNFRPWVLRIFCFANIRDRTSVYFCKNVCFRQLSVCSIIIFNATHQLITACWNSCQRWIRFTGFKPLNIRSAKSTKYWK